MFLFVVNDFGTFEGVNTDIRFGDDTSRLGFDGGVVIGKFLCGTFFGGSDVDFVTLVTRDSSDDGGDDPCTVQDTSHFQGKTDAEEDVTKWMLQECEGESRSE